MGLTRNSEPRTLTEALRAFDLDQLTTLLLQRDDLGDPIPHDLTELGEHGRAQELHEQALAMRQRITEQQAAPES